MAALAVLLVVAMSPVACGGDSTDGGAAGTGATGGSGGGGAGSNQPPTVSAGNAQIVVFPTSAALDGTVEDDGLPDPPGALTVAWTESSGPGDVTFADAAAQDTTATFSETGSYVLRLSANDGELESTDEVTVTVNDPPDPGGTQLSECSNDGCVLTIPRYKIFMSHNDPDVLWVAFQNGSSENLMKSVDGGLTWDAADPDGLTIRGYLDYHASVDGDGSDNLYVTDPGSGNVFFRKLNAPGAAQGDFGPELLLTSSTIGSYNTRSNLLVQDENNIWVFSRTSSQALGNVRYFRSTNGGASFDEEGWVSETGSDNVRIGSLLIDGMPAVVIKYVSYPAGDNIDYRYFIWDGGAFVANADADIVRDQHLAQQREYSMSYVDGAMHLVWNQGPTLRHAYKEHNGGTGSWTYGDIETLGYSPRDWHPSLSRQGTSLFLFYIRQESDTVGHNNVYFRQWDAGTSSWSSAMALTTNGAGHRFPHGPAVLNPAADYVPVIWSAPPGVVMIHRLFGTP